MSNDGGNVARAAWAFNRWINLIPTANRPIRSKEDLAEADRMAKIIELETRAARQARKAEQG